MKEPTNSHLNIICLESKAFQALVDQVVERVSHIKGKSKDKWIDDVEAMELLHIRSKTTLQNYRDTGKIRFTHPSKKVILYDRDSIMKFLDQNAKDTF